MVKLRGKNLGFRKAVLYGCMLLMGWGGGTPEVWAGASRSFSAYPLSRIQLLSLGRQHSPDAIGKGKGARAVLLSLLIPGAGEWYLGHRKAAKIFLGAELALWAGYLGSLAYADVLKKDYQTFAALHAGVDPVGKNEQYWIDIGNANNIYDLNEKRLVQRNLEAVYTNIGEFYWQWDSESHRYRYVDLRLKQHSWRRTATFMIGGMILNRILSTMDVVRILRKGKREGRVGGRARVSSRYFWHPIRGETIQVHLTWKF